jgi:CRP-like cAMP-binding protein
MLNGQQELLQGLSPDETEKALALGSLIALTSGEELFHLGTEAGSLYLVTRGRIRLTLPMQVRGREEHILVEERSPGQTVGWSALIPPYRFTLTATALVHSEVLAIPGDALRGHFAASPAAGCAISLNLAAVIGQRLQLFQAMWLREVERMVELRCA